MPQTLRLILVHVIFSTKDRLPVLRDDLRPLLHSYLASIARAQRCECFRVGGVADHVHLAISLSTTMTVAKLVQELKTGSSKWLKEQGLPRFAWQRGYAVFSVAPGDREMLLRYIETQETHHRKRSFEDELRAFCTKYHVALDEHYVWD